MKLLATIAAGSVALATLAVPATAQRTTVTRVHGPMRLLPHHKRKVCQTKWVAHHRVKKCNYH